MPVAHAVVVVVEAVVRVTRSNPQTTCAGSERTAIGEPRSTIKRLYSPPLPSQVTRITAHKGPIDRRTKGETEGKGAKTTVM